MRLFRRETPTPLPAFLAGSPVPGYRDVTVLFADLEGFTTLTEALPAEEVVAALNAHFAVMAQAVEEQEGWIDKYMGDAMFVIWHSPDPGLAAARALQAAIALQAGIGRLQQEWLLAGRYPIKVRLGISSGRVLLGTVGAGRRRELTMIGDAINTAARLEALNKEYHTDTILSEATYQLAGPRAVVRDLGRVQLKGRREPVRAYALLGWGTK